MENEREDVQSRVVRLLNEYLARRGVTATVEEAEDLQALGIDSLAITELVFEIAEEFDIDDRLVSDEALLGIRTLDDLVTAVVTATNAQRSQSP